MKNNYRENSLDPKEWRKLTSEERIDITNAESNATFFCDQIDDVTEYIYYKNWVNIWKILYREASEMITGYEKSGRQHAAYRMKRVANTLLNAREFGKSRVRNCEIR